MFLESRDAYPLPRDAIKIPIDKTKIKAIPTFCAGDKYDVTDVQNYLKHYGYMPLSADMSSVEVTEDTCTAIKAFQKFFNLTVDGVFGPETKEAMTQDRCGFPDLLHSVDFFVGSIQRAPDPMLQGHDNACAVQ